MCAGCSCGGVAEMCKFFTKCAFWLPSGNGAVAEGKTGLAGPAVTPDYSTSSLEVWWGAALCAGVADVVRLKQCAKKHQYVHMGRPPLPYLSVTIHKLTMALLRQQTTFSACQGGPARACSFDVFAVRWFLASAFRRASPGGWQGTQDRLSSIAAEPIWSL